MTYYRQLLAADNAPADYDPSRKAPFQQYDQINNLVLMVTSPLTWSQDQTSKEFTVNGNANAFGFLMPNKGDVFTAVADGGAKALFMVTASEKTTYMKAANYSVSYVLLDYLSDTIEADLAKKVQATYTFSMDALQNGLNPLMDADQYATTTGLSALYQDLLALYFRDFFSQARQTLLIPDQPFESYDPFLAKAMAQMTGSEDALVNQRIRLPAVFGDAAMTNVTVWDSILETTKTPMLTGIQRVGLAPTTIFRAIPYLSGIFFTGINQVVYPYDARTDVDARYGWVEHPPIYGYQNDQTPRYPGLTRLTEAVDNAFFEGCAKEAANAKPVQLPSIVSVSKDNYYVFTEGFYKARSPVFASQLEAMTWQAIDQQLVDAGALLKLARQAFHWPNLERFYYIPVLLALMNLSKQAGV